MYTSNITDTVCVHFIYAVKTCYDVMMMYSWEQYMQNHPELVVLGDQLQSCKGATLTVKEGCC